jgi:hypothetical protein
MYLFLSIGIGISHSLEELCNTNSNSIYVVNIDNTIIKIKIPHSSRISIV